MISRCRENRDWIVWCFWGTVTCTSVPRANHCNRKCRGSHVSYPDNFQALRGRDLVALPGGEASWIHLRRRGGTWGGLGGRRSVGLWSRCQALLGFDSESRPSSALGPQNRRYHSPQLLSLYSISFFSCLCRIALIQLASEKVACLWRVGGARRSLFSFLFEIFLFEYHVNSLFLEPTQYVQEPSSLASQAASGPRSASRASWFEHVYEHEVAFLAWCYFTLRNRFMNKGTLILFYWFCAPSLSETGECHTLDKSEHA